MLAIEKKEKQINDFLKEALDLQREIEEVNRLAAQVSEKFQNFGGGIKKSSKDFGEIARIIASGNSKHKKNADIIGDLTEISVDILGNLTGIFGKWWGNRKKNKELKKLLPAKQELARNKLNVITKTIPKLTRSKAQVLKICKTDANLVIDFNDTKRFKQIKTGIKKGFEAFFTFENLEQTCKYMEKEFHAWINGKHYSDMEKPESSIVFANCVGKLIEWSDIPNPESAYLLPEKLSVGGILLLTDKELSEASKMDSKINRLSTKIASAKIKSSLLPFGKRSKLFKSYYNNLLIDSNIITEEVAIKKKETIRNSFIFTVILAVTLYFIILFYK